VKMTTSRKPRAAPQDYSWRLWNCDSPPLQEIPEVSSRSQLPGSRGQLTKTESANRSLHGAPASNYPSSPNIADHRQVGPFHVSSQFGKITGLDLRNVIQS